MSGQFERTSERTSERPSIYIPTTGSYIDLTTGRLLVPIARCRADSHCAMTVLQLLLEIWYEFDQFLPLAEIMYQRHS